jgi:hypothetical protein
MKNCLKIFLPFCFSVSFIPCLAQTKTNTINIQNANGGVKIINYYTTPAGNGGANSGGNTYRPKGGVLIIPKFKIGAPIQQSIDEDDAQIAMAKVRQYLPDSVHVLDAALVMKEKKGADILSMITATGATMFIEAMLEKKKDDDTYAVTFSVVAVDIATGKTKYKQSFSSDYYRTEDAGLLLENALKDKEDILKEKLGEATRGVK